MMNRQELGYPALPVISPNSTFPAMGRELDRWRAEMITALELDIATIEHWNITHPTERQFSTDFEREMIKWVREFPSDSPPPLPRPL